MPSTRDKAIHFINEPQVLGKYPTLRHGKFSEATIGDIHGNALTLIFFLIRENIIKLSESNYKKIVSLYQSNDFTKNTFEDFKAVIDNITPTKTNKLLRLIGDDLCDRGQNDYFTLLLYKKLTELNINFEILLSNHAMAFLNALYKFPLRKYLKTNYFSGDVYSNSLSNLNLIIQHNIVSIDEISDIIDKTYLTHLKAVSFSYIAPDVIILYTHAPTDLRIIKNLGLKFNINIDESTIETLIDSINNINKAFQNCTVSHKFISSSLYHPRNFCNLDNFLTNDTPIEDITWNRIYDYLNWQKNINNYKVYYAYGHDKTQICSKYDNNFGLDNDFGKSLQDLYSSRNFKALLIEGL